jgi:hypothetical protein
MLQTALTRASDRADAWFAPTDREWRHRWGAAPAMKEIGPLAEREWQPSRLPLEWAPRADNLFGPCDHAADIVEMRPGLGKGDELTIAEHPGGELTVSC